MEWALSVATALGLLLLFALAEAISRHGFPPEATRQLVHVAGAICAATFPLFLQQRDVLLLGVAFSALLSWTRQHGRLRSVHAVRRPTAGAVLFPVGIGLTAALLWAHPAAYVFGILVLALADPAASFTGQSLPGPRWAVAAGDKSVAGSATFFVVTLLLAVVIGAGWGHVGSIRVVVTAGILTAIEGMLGYGTDNLPVPVVAGMLGQTLLGL